jgi:hypothetical protein
VDIRKLSIAKGSPKSVGQDLFESYQRGEISFQKYIEGNALLAADLSRTAIPRAYTPMSEKLTAYVAGRINNLRDRDQELAKSLGIWIAGVQRAREWNEGEREHFAWAMEICLRIKVIAQAQKLEEAILRFKNLPFPTEAMHSALKVQEMDILASQRGGK